MNQRVLVRSSVMSALADSGYGFNASYRDALQSGEYPGAKNFELDFGPDSRNVLQSYITSQEDVDLSRTIEQTTGTKIALLVFTSLMRNERREKFRQFSGSVVCHLHFYIRLAENGDSIADTEDTADAIEDAVTRVFCGIGRPATWRAGVVFNGDINCERPPVRWIQDGYEQLVPFDLTFGVSV